MDLKGKTCAISVYIQSNTHPIERAFQSNLGSIYPIPIYTDIYNKYCKLKLHFESQGEKDIWNVTLAMDSAKSLTGEKDTFPAKFSLKFIN